MQSRGRTYQQHITVEKKIRWIEVKPNTPLAHQDNAQACNCYYCPVCDTATVVTDILLNALPSDQEVDESCVIFEVEPGNVQNWNCHYCSVCSTATIVIDTVPTALAPDQEIDENYSTIFVQDESGIYPIYHDNNEQTSV